MINEQCPEYTVGENKTSTVIVVNPYASKGIIYVARGRNNHWQKKPVQNDHSNTQTYNAYLGFGNCITNNDSIFYATTKSHLCEEVHI